MNVEVYDDIDVYPCKIPPQFIQWFIQFILHKSYNKLSVAEKEIGGIPNSSEDIRQAHAAAIESYIDKHVGLKEDNTYGDLYFNKTLNDWALFDINKRTKYDAAISSGLAIMACNKNRYKPAVARTTKKLEFGFKKYNNQGTLSKILK